MVTTKQMNIKNRTYYFYDDIVDIKYFDPNLKKLDKNSFKNIGVYYIGYITKKGEYKINSVNPLYLLVYKIGSSIKEIEGSKYLNIAYTDSNSEVLKKYEDVCSGIKDCIVNINDGKSGKYGKDYMKIKFNSDDGLPLNKQLKFRSITIIVRSVFEESGKYYPQIFLDECLYEVQILEHERIDVSQGIDLNKSHRSKECDICHYWYFLDKNFDYESYLCNGCHDLMQKAVNLNDVAIVSI